MKENIDRKNVIWNMIGATANAFTSLIFTIIVTRINGLEQAGIFTYAFATACLFFIIASYAGRTFQVTDVAEKYSDTDYIYHRIITCIMMMGGIILFTTIKGYNIEKVSIMVLLCLYRAIEAFCEVLYAILQKKEYLYKVGISMTIRAILSIFILLIIDSITHNLILSCISIVLCSVCVLLFYDFKNVKQVKVVKTKFQIQKIKSLFLSGFFTFLITFLGTYVINAPRYAIDDMLENELQTIFGIIIMPATFMGLMGQYIIQPVLTKITKYMKENNIKELKKLIYKIIGIILCIGLFVLFIAYLLEAPILGFIYGVDLKPYIVDMLIIIFGSIMYSLGIIISYVLIAFRKTFIQAIVYIVVSVLTTIVSYLLVKRFSIIGASITYMLTMLSIALCFFAYLIIYLKKLAIEWNKK